MEDVMSMQCARMTDQPMQSNALARQAIPTQDPTPMLHAQVDIGLNSFATCHLYDILRVTYF